VLQQEEAVSATQTHDDLAVGDRIRFMPQAGNRWWTIRARDERYLVATQSALFKPQGHLWYAVVDLTGWQDRTYNGQGDGIVRSSLNTLGGGWDIGPDGEGCDEVLAAIASGEWELSHRRILRVDSIERDPQP
jgi:hypothetical protein